MLKERIPETDHGITGEFNVLEYDEFQKKMRDRGIIETNDIIKSGISSGTVLEIGPGPGYLGLEWLKKTEGTKLNWLEISEDMKNIALKNAEEYGLINRIKVTLSDATNAFPFKDETFDAVFSNGSLHEWSDPISVFNEISRILKKGGRFFISDLKRNINPFLGFIIKITTKKKSMKKGFISSVNASYLNDELTEILSVSNISNFVINENPFGFEVTGIKE